MWLWLHSVLVELHGRKWSPNWMSFFWAPTKMSMRMKQNIIKRSYIGFISETLDREPLLAWITTSRLAPNPPSWSITIAMSLLLVGYVSERHAYVCQRTTLFAAATFSSSISGKTILPTESINLQQVILNCEKLFSKMSCAVLRDICSSRSYAYSWRHLRARQSYSQHTLVLKL